MEFSKKLLTGLTMVALVVGVNAQADSELDGAVKAPSIIVSKLDTATQTVTNYAVDRLPEGLSTQALEGLSPEARQAQVQAFLDQVAKPENKISEEKATAEASELDQDGSTGATWRRWRRWGHGGYYGGGFYYTRNYYYRPYWGYNHYRGYYNCYTPNYYYQNYGYGYGSAYYTVYGW